MFKKARLKLTAWYLLILMFITVSFSSVVYFRVVDNTRTLLLRHERRMESRMRDSPGFGNMSPKFQGAVTDETLKEVKSRTLYLLIVVNSVILFVAGTLSYWLAGLTLDPIKQMHQKQKDFVADAAHEFKTPLTSIKTQLEVALRDKKLNLTDAKDVMKSTIEDIDSLSFLTRSLLKQSEYLNQNDPESLTEFSLDSLIHKLIKDFEPRLKEEKLQVNITGDDFRIKANRNSIKELLSILLDNAIKFSDSGDRIELRYFLEGNQVHIEVEDEGIGIADEDQDRIFDRFYKVSSSRTHGEDDGFGLGLSIAREIVRNHKGSIRVKSQLGDGSVFYVKFPQEN